MGKNILLFACLLFFAIACKKKQKQLPINTMKMIVWDLSTADEWIIEQGYKDTNILKNKENLKLFDAIFKSYNIDRATFYSSYKYYEENPSLMKDMLDSVTAYGTKKKEVLLNKPKPKK